ncbi:MAG: hypothetical protein RLZZ422_2089 [Pseudomonadota bacterium]|jgi:hypothetical protein
MSAPNPLITQHNIVRELRTLPPHQLQEVLDFVRFIRKKPTVIGNTTPKAPPKPKYLLEFAGHLKDSPNFNQDPLVIQQELRSEWS